jgi:hypothetical protein
MINDPNRFKSFHEPLLSTITRTGAIAVGVATMLVFARLHRVPATWIEWRLWLVLIAAIAWPSFGGHWVELFYLNRMRPRLAGWSDSRLIFVRLGTWLVGGAILFAGAAITYSLLLTGTVPQASFMTRALLLGGPLLVGVECIVHLFLLLTGKPSFWNFRG